MAIRILNKKLMILWIIYFAAATSAFAQNMSCGNAVSQLQMYVGNVNQAAQQEYYSIPMRCGNNPNCTQVLLQQLNGWYMNQSNLVNGWFQQIQSNCSSNNQQITQVGRTRPSRSRAPELNEDDVADLEVDDEDKTVRIRIPSNPSGFR